MEISEILSSLTDEDIRQLKSVASTLMSDKPQEKKSEKTETDNLFSSSMLGNLGRIGNAISAEDERTALLKALKPMLSEQRQSRVDDAIKILRIIQLLPVLRESGLLNGLL